MCGSGVNSCNILLNSVKELFDSIKGRELLDRLNDRLSRALLREVDSSCVSLFNKPRGRYCMQQNNLTEMKSC